MTNRDRAEYIRDHLITSNWESATDECDFIEMHLKKVAEEEREAACNLVKTHDSWCSNSPDVSCIEEIEFKIRARGQL